MSQMTFLVLGENNCDKLFCNPCTNVEIMARSAKFDHFIGWPLRVTLIFNLLEQMFQMAILLLRENTCAKLF